MNESILKALMRLFAIIANVNADGISDKSRSIVESYLKLQLSLDQVNEYLELFDLGPEPASQNKKSHYI